MATRIEVINMALGLLGAQPAASPDDGSVGANLALRFYDTVRDSVLSASNWGFALVRAELAKLGTVPAFGYRYAYSLPPDFLRAVSLSENAAGYDWDIQSGCLLIDLDSDSAPLLLLYLARVTDESLFPPDFALALSAKLASVMAPSLLSSGQGANVSARMEEQYLLLLARARYSDAQNRHVRPEAADNGKDGWLNKRG